VDFRYLHRIDIHLEVPRVDYEKLADKRNEENSETIRLRVQGSTGTEVAALRRDEVDV